MLMRPESNDVLDEIFCAVRRELSGTVSAYGRDWRLRFVRGGDVFAWFPRYRWGVLLGKASGGPSGVLYPGGDVQVNITVETRDKRDIRADLTAKFGRPPESELNVMLKPVMVAKG